MKTLCMYIAICSVVASCTEKQKTSDGYPKSVTISVLVDITDPKLFWPAPDQVLQLFNAKENPTAEFTFHLEAISDKRLNPRKTYHLADATTTDNKNDQHDPQNRNRNILAFYTTLRKSINDFYSHTDTSLSMQHSECYRAISDELILLGEDSSEQKTLIIFSDLLEKSDILNSYVEDISHPLKIAEELDAVYPKLPTLKGITIIFIFDPRDRKEDKAFSYMSEAYKILLQKKGGIVTVRANL